MDHIWNYLTPLTEHQLHICTIPDHAKQYLPDGVDWSPFNGTCIEHLRKDGVFEIWIILDDLSPLTCCHEAVHAALGILNRVGIPINYDNQETLAYMTASIFEMTRDAVFKHYERLGKKA